MFLLCWESTTTSDWEVVSGEDAMQIRVGEIMKEQDIEAGDIHVFDMEDEIK